MLIAFLLVVLVPLALIIALSCPWVGLWLLIGTLLLAVAWVLWEDML